MDKETKTSLMALAFSVTMGLGAGFMIGSKPKQVDAPLPEPDSTRIEAVKDFQNHGQQITTHKLPSNTYRIPTVRPTSLH